MPQLSFEECKEVHKRMWKWLEKNPNKPKSDWPEWELIADRYDGYYCHGGSYKGVFIPYFCFACYWACGEKRMENNEIEESSNTSHRDCMVCPITWCDPHSGSVIEARSCEDTVCNDDGEFGYWNYEENKASLKKLANTIANKEWTDHTTIPDDGKINED